MSSNQTYLDKLYLGLSEGQDISHIRIPVIIVSNMTYSKC